MILLTFDEILTYICDSFDTLISPAKLARSNTNIIYLLFKAIAKGMELINSICVTLNNKFDPARCTVADLNSVAMLVGTERLKGSGSGLPIIANNNTDATITLPQGTYTYALDEDTKFVFELLENTPVSAHSDETFIAMSENIGSYPVTAQAEIQLTSDVSIPVGIKFSCEGNETLLGTDEESDLAFRERILTSHDTQDSMSELETQLRNLPYIFDCKIKFNNTLLDIVYDGVVVHPFTALIYYSGAPRSEMAGMIANKIICPTVALADAVPLKYESSAFVDGVHTFYINPFGKALFDIQVLYEVNELYISEYDAQTAIEKAIRGHYRLAVHRSYVKNDDICNIINGLKLEGVNLLSVSLFVDGAEVEYVSIPVSKVPAVHEITFRHEGD